MVKMFSKSTVHDASYVEKGDKLGAPVFEDEDGAVHHESFEAGNTLYARLQRVAGKYGVEQRGLLLNPSTFEASTKSGLGIERVPENERTDKSLIKVATLVSRDAHLVESKI